MLTKGLMPKISNTGHFPSVFHHNPGVKLISTLYTDTVDG